MNYDEKRVRNNLKTVSHRLYLDGTHLDLWEVRQSYVVSAPVSWYVAYRSRDRFAEQQRYKVPIIYIFHKVTRLYEKYKLWVFYVQVMYLGDSTVRSTMHYYVKNCTYVWCYRMLDIIMYSMLNIFNALHVLIYIYILPVTCIRLTIFYHVLCY